MKKYEINRLAVLIDVMAECIGNHWSEILTTLQGICIDEEDAGSIRRELEGMEE